MNDDTISRQAAIDAMNAKLEDIKLRWRGKVKKGEIAMYLDMRGVIETVPPAETEIIHCCDCIYYDPEHIENNGVRYEYRDMPKDAFDILGTGLVNLEYGINVGGRCCRDYNVGYSDDKRVFVSGQNYCGRAERRQDG